MEEGGANNSKQANSANICYPEHQRERSVASYCRNNVLRSSSTTTWHHVDVEVPKAGRNGSMHNVDQHIDLGNACFYLLRFLFLSKDTLSA